VNCKNTMCSSYHYRINGKFQDLHSCNRDFNNTGIVINLFKADMKYITFTVHQDSHRGQGHLQDYP